MEDKEQILDEDNDTVESEQEQSEKPDGGWGWVVCCGTFSVNFIVFGIHNSFGVVYEYLVDEQHMGEAETAWVGAMAGSLNFLCGPLTSILCDRFGCRRVAFVGALLSVTGLFLTSLVTRLHYMYLTYGLLWGVGSSFSFVPSIVMLGEYFDKRLALANGLGTSGSGVGSLVASPAINYLLWVVGWSNSLRILSGVAAFLVVACFLYKPLKTRQRDRAVTKQCSQLCDVSIWRNRAYVAWVLTVALFQFGYPVPFVHLVKYANDLGIPTSKGAWLVGFLSIMSTVGRVIFGKICELRWVNKVYVYQFSVFIIGISTMICPITEGYAGLLTYSLVFGFFDGCFVGQVAVITGEIAGKNRLSQAVGNMFGVLAIPMSFGPPVAGWLYEATGSYHQAFFVCGSVGIMASLFVFVVSRLHRNQRQYYISSRRGSKNTDSNKDCRYEGSLETESEMSNMIRGETTSREVLIVADKETVL